MAQGDGTALLVIDMLNDFLAGPFAGPAAERLIGPVKAAVNHARARGVPVIFICDAHAVEDEEFKVLPPHAIAGTHGAEIVDELAPQEDETVVRKRRYSGFFETELAEVLRGFGSTRLPIVGCRRTAASCTRSQTASSAASNR